MPKGYTNPQSEFKPTIKERLSDFTLLGEVSVPSGTAGLIAKFTSAQLHGLTQAGVPHNAWVPPNVASVILPYDIFNTSKIFRDLTKNAFGYTCDFEFNIRAIATAPTTGLLCFYYYPLMFLTSAWNVAARSHRTAISESPMFRVLNIASDNPEINFTVKFASNTLFNLREDLNSEQQSRKANSVLYISKMTEIRDNTSQPSVKLIMMAAVRNLKFYSKMPDPTDLRVISNSIFTTEPHYSGGVIVPPLPPGPLPGPKPLIPQGGENANEGGISGNIIARTLIEAGIAGMGLSKPDSTEGSNAILPSKSMTNATGTDDSVALAVINTPATQLATKSVKEDALDFATIAAREYLFETFSITKGQTATDVICVVALHPLAYRHFDTGVSSHHGQVIGFSQNYFCASRLGYAAAPFALWSADKFVLRLQGSVNSQHTIQMLVQYIPSYPQNGYFQAYATETVANSWIIDMNDKEILDGVKLEVDLTQKQQWLNMISPEVHTQEYDLLTTPGFLVFTLLTAPTNTALVSNTTDYALFASWEGFKVKGFGYNTPQPILITDKPTKRTAICFDQTLGGAEEYDTTFRPNYASGKLNKRLVPQGLGINSPVTSPEPVPEIIVDIPAIKEERRKRRRKRQDPFTNLFTSINNFLSSLVGVLEQTARIVFYSHKYKFLAPEGKKTYSSTDYERITNIRTLLKIFSIEAPRPLRSYSRLSGSTRDALVVSWAPIPHPYLMKRIERKHNGHVPWFGGGSSLISLRNYYSMIFAGFIGDMRFKAKMIKMGTSAGTLLSAGVSQNADYFRNNDDTYGGYNSSCFAPVTGLTDLEIAVQPAIAEPFWINGMDDDIWRQTNAGTGVYYPSPHRPNNPVVNFTTLAMVDGSSTNISDIQNITNVNDYSHTLRMHPGPSEDEIIDHRNDLYNTIIYSAFGDSADYFGQRGAPPFTLGPSKHQYEWTSSN
jgi:hypothetical protein